MKIKIKEYSNDKISYKLQILSIIVICNIPTVGFFSDGWRESRNSFPWVKQILQYVVRLLS